MDNSPYIIISNLVLKFKGPKFSHEFWLAPILLDNSLFIIFSLLFFFLFIVFYNSVINAFNFVIQKVSKKPINSLVNIEMGSLLFYQLSLLFLLLLYFFIADWYQDSDNFILNSNAFFENNIFYIIVFFILFFIFLILVYFWTLFFKGTYKLDIGFILLWAFYSLVVLLFSKHLLILYVSLEILTVCSYVLVAAQFTSSLSIEAAIKYLILAALSSGFFVLGIFFFYILLGTFDIYDFFLFLFIKNNIFMFSSSFFNLLLLSFFLIFISLFFKIGLAPFHFWMPDVYQGSALPITAFFAILPKIVYFILFLKFFSLLNSVFFLQFFYLEYFCYIVACLSLFIGTFGALSQTKIKRFLAYSSIVHMSYVLFSICYLFSIENLFSCFFYLFSYIILNIGIFSILLLLPNIKIFNNIFSNSFTFTLLNKQLFLLCIFWIFFFLSLAGIPPFLGFFAKFFILKSLMQSPLFYFIFILTILSTLSLFYYLRFIIYCFFLSSSNKQYHNSWYLMFLSSNFLYYLCSYIFLFNLFYCLDINSFFYFFNYLLKLSNNEFFVFCFLY